MDEGHYHFHVGQVQRSQGHSACAAAAYRAGVKLADERTGEVRDYSKRSGVLFAEVIAPEDAPGWARDREALWNRAEAYEKRKDAQVARIVDFGLPHQVSDEDRIALVRAFVTNTFVRDGMVADIAIHAPDRHGDQRNVHAHVMLTLRRVGPDGFAIHKETAWNSREALKAWRAAWAQAQNELYEKRGLAIRVDHRSFKDRGIEREPTLKIGRNRMAMARKGLEPKGSERDYTDAELKFLRDYHLAEAVKQRWMRHPKTRYAKLRRAAFYKQKEQGDRLWENFRRAKQNYRRKLDENKRLRAEVAAAKNEAFMLKRAQQRADERVNHIFAGAFANGEHAKAKFAEFARRKGVIAAAEAALRRPEQFGRMRGLNLFGQPDKERKEGQKLLRYLGERVVAVEALGEQRGRAENWLTQLQNRLEFRIGHERNEVRDWAWTVDRYRALNDRAREWKRLKEEKSLLRMEQEREIALLRAQEDARIQSLDADGRFEEASARRYNQMLYGIQPPAQDETTKRMRKELNQQRLIWARRADAERQEQRRSRTRTIDEQALIDSHYVAARVSPWFYDEEGR